MGRLTSRTRARIQSSRSSRAAPRKTCKLECEAGRIRGGWSGLELYLVRHAITQENLSYRLIGRTDPPLHRLGIASAGHLAHRLRGEKLQLIVSSPLKRARQTAEAIRIAYPAHDRPPLAFDPDLREIDLGCVDGMSSFDAYVAYRDLVDQALSAGAPDDFAFPGGEPRDQALHRFDQALANLTRTYPEGHVCVVTHGGLIGMLLARILGRPLAAFRALAPAHASITRLRLADATGPELLERGSLSHLPHDLIAAIQSRYHKIG